MINIGNSILKKQYFLIISLFILPFSLSSCQNHNTGCGNKNYSFRELSQEDPKNIEYKGHYKIGKPYKIKGKKYTPKEVKKYKKIGIASWYGERYGFHGKKTANGDIYNKNMLTAAHKTLQLPSLVKVTNLENKKSLIVMVNDRGPYSYNREIDLSEKAASMLGMKRKGTAKVKVEYLHAESQTMLKKLGLKPKSGFKSKGKFQNRECSVNCEIKLANLYYKSLKK